MKKPEKGHEVTKVERIADAKVVIHHDNGDTFEGNVDRSKIQFRSDSWGNRYFLGSGVGREGSKVGNVMTNEDRRKMGIEEDPGLPDYEGKKVSKGSSDPNLAK